MSWTKRQIIKQAFVEVGLASYVYDLTADELADSLRILDSMMAEWFDKGIVFDPVFPIPTEPGGGDIDDPTNAPVSANAPMYYNLAVRLAPGFGKTPSNYTMLQAERGFSLVSQAIPVPSVQMVGMIRGAGAKTPIRPFIGEADTTV